MYRPSSTQQKYIATAVVVVVVVVGLSMLLKKKKTLSAPRIVSPVLSVTPVAANGVPQMYQGAKGLMWNNLSHPADREMGGYHNVTGAYSGHDFNQIDRAFTTQVVNLNADPLGYGVIQGQVPSDAPVRGMHGKLAGARFSPTAVV